MVSAILHRRVSKFLLTKIIKRNPHFSKSVFLDNLVALTDGECHFFFYLFYIGVDCFKKTRLHSRAQVRHLLVMYFVCICSVFFAAAKASTNRGKTSRWIFFSCFSYRRLIIFDNQQENTKTMISVIIDRLIPSPFALRSLFCSHGHHCCFSSIRFISFFLFNRLYIITVCYNDRGNCTI